VAGNPTRRPIKLRALLVKTHVARLVRYTARSFVRARDPEKRLQSPPAFTSQSFGDSLQSINQSMLVCFLCQISERDKAVEESTLYLAALQTELKVSDLGWLLCCTAHDS
jgi:hypothetical protein